MMIIECINCKKLFNVNSDLIPAEGRQIKCGSCNHIWHYKRENSSKIHTPNNTQSNLNNLSSSKNDIENKKVSTTLENKELYQNINTNDDHKIQKNLDLTNRRNNMKMSNFFSYLLVIIISFVIFIILIDTLKLPLINFFPKLEIIMFNLFETIKDIKLFIIDLT